MTPYWLGLEPGVFVVCLALLVVGALAFWAAYADRQRRAAERLRRAVLSQLLLAARRALPLGRALGVLGEDLDRLAERHPRALWFPLLGNRTWERGALRWQARAAHDLATGVAEGDLRCLSRVAWRAFPAPLPDVLSEAHRRGTLVLVLEELQRVDDDALRLRGEVRGRLLYPSLVLLVVLLPLAFLEVVIWPKFAEIGAAVASAQAPALAHLTWLRHALLVAVPALLVGLWVCAGALVTGRGRLLRWLAPVRWVEAALARARGARLLLAHLRAGVPLAEALRALGAVGALRAARAEEAAARAADGAGLAAALEVSGLLPRGELERLPRDGAHAADALALVSDALTREAAVRVDLVARATLPLALLLIGALVAVTHWGTHLALDAWLRESMPW